MGWEEVIKTGRTATKKTRTKKKKWKSNRKENRPPVETTFYNETSVMGDPDAEHYESVLAAYTRKDLMDLVMEKINEMSEKELIALLVKTKGDLKEVDLT